MMFAKAYDATRDIGQSFDKEKITLKKGGKEFNVYDAIQAANVDLNIYEVLEKYNCSGDITPAQAAKFITNQPATAEMFQDFSKIQEIGDLRDIMEYKNKANEMFGKLPLEIRNKFNNDALLFAQNGEKWLQEEIKKQQQKATEQQKVTEQQKETPNEQK